MTPAAIAEFVQSDAGALYRMSCERFGVDPGAVLEDDVLGYNLRVGLLVASLDTEEDPQVPIAEGGSINYSGGIR